MTLDVAQALFSVGQLPGEELPSLAVNLLQEGVDTPTLRELAGLNAPTLKDAGPLFERLLSELDRQPMTQDDAALIVAKDLATRVLNGTLSPEQAARRGSLLSMSFDYHPLLTPFLADDDDYDCLPGDREAIDEDVRRYCQELVDRPHG